MTRGFLLIDQQMNTIIIPMDSDEFQDAWRHTDISKVHQHRTLKELDLDVRAYLRNAYKEEED